MAKRSFPAIEEGRIRLRLIEATDLSTTLSWRNQANIRKWFLNSEIISPNRHLEWYQRYLERDDDFLFIIEEDRALRRPVGQLSIYNIQWDLKRAEFGRLLIGEPRATGLGLAKEACRLLVRYSVSDLQITTLVLEVYRENRPAISIYRACGFEETGGDDNLMTMIRIAK